MRRSRKAMLTLIAAEMAGLYGSAVLATPTVSTFYIAGQIAQNSSFSVGTQSISISNASPTVFVPLGDYFEFGISTVTTNNPNVYNGVNVNGDAWDLANQVRGNPPQPATLGLAFVNYSVDTTLNNSSGSILAPMEGASRGTYKRPASLLRHRRFFQQLQRDNSRQRRRGSQ